MVSYQSSVEPVCHACYQVGHKHILGNVLAVSEDQGLDTCPGPRLVLLEALPKVALVEGLLHPGLHTHATEVPGAGGSNTMISFLMEDHGLLFKS